MKNRKSPLLNTLHGKTIQSHHISDAHGEVLIIFFTDGSELHVCSTFGLCDESIKPDVNNIYVTINNVAI